MSSPHFWITIWIILSSILVIWDVGYCFSRPRSFHGGDLHWIWKPYALYQNIDLVYGVEAHRRGDGFTNAQSLLNVFEVAANFFYVYKAQIAPDPVAPVIGLCAAIATFSKTVLYWAQEYYCNYCAVGHNDRWTLFWMWIIPNGAWLIVPGFVIRTLYKDVAASLRATGAPGRAMPAARKANASSNKRAIKLAIYVHSWTLPPTSAGFIARQKVQGSLHPPSDRRVSYDTAMFDYSSVAVEIWWQILQWVIDADYIFDTVMNTEANYRRNSNRYHDGEVYKESERQRKILRLVCRSWRAYSDDHQYRWITYSTRNDADPSMQREALKAIQPTNVDGLESVRTTGKPRRVLFHIENEHDFDMFRAMLDHCASKVTILFTECCEGSQHAMFDHLINSKAKLPNLLCLAVWIPQSYFRPLRALSTAFPSLVTLSISHSRDAPYTPCDGDFLTLPDLTILGFDFAAFNAESLRNWNLQRIVHLVTPIRASSLANGLMASDPFKVLGENLVVINIHQIFIGDVPMRLPVEFWAWCPRLTELLMFFSGIAFDTPVPADHPLKYVVHWPNYDNMPNAQIGEPNTSVLLNNLHWLPTGVEVCVIWKSWPEYMEFLSPRYNHDECILALIRMEEVCLKRNLRIEDQSKMSLASFLGMIRQERVSVQSSLRGQ